MKCEKCPADSALGCTAGVKPYQLRSGDTGCSWNLRTIKKHMNQSKPTNYDSLIRKTPEELAEIMVSDCPPNYPKGECREYEKYDGNLDCRQCWLDWMKEEVQNEQT